MLIFNADDFGLSSEINKAIIDCFLNGLITSTTIMANMPGFEEACEYANEKQIINNIGLHININEGYPLTDKIKYYKKFCNNEGQLNFKRNKNYLYNKEEREVLQKEIKAQIDRCRKYGIKLTHADSHHHVHTEIPLFIIIENILIQNNINKIRLANNMHKNIIKILYKTTFNQYVKMKKYGFTDTFVDLITFLNMGNGSNKNIEIMVHPTYNIKNKIIDKSSNILLDSELLKKIKELDIVKIKA